MTDDVVSSCVQDEGLGERPWDGPSKKLLAYMEENSVSAWKGYAALD